MTSRDRPFRRRTVGGGVLAALVGFAAPPFGAAGAAEIKIDDIRAYVFLEQAGRMSDDLIGGEALVNAPRGGAPGGDSATGLLIDLTFEGDKNASPKGAVATVDLAQTNRAGDRILTHKAFSNFVFGPEGVEHKAIFLEGATCMPLTIDVRAGRTTKSARLDFQCDVVRPPK